MAASVVGKRMRVGPGEEAADAVNLGDLIAGGPGYAFAEAKAARNTTASFATIPNVLRVMKNSLLRRKLKCGDGDGDRSRAMSARRFEAHLRCAPQCPTVLPEQLLLTERGPELAAATRSHGPDEYSIVREVLGPNVSVVRVWLLNELNRGPAASRVAANHDMSVLASKAGRRQGAEEGPASARWEGMQRIQIVITCAGQGRR